MEGRLKRPTSVAVIMAPRQHVASYSEWSYVFKIRSSLSSSTLATGNFGSSPLTLFFFLVSADSGAASVLLVLCQISGDAKRERINRLCPSKGMYCTCWELSDL